MSHSAKCIMLGCLTAVAEKPSIPADYRDAWLALLHYWPSDGAWVSEIDDADFFLDPRGRRDPEREWNASRTAFLSVPPESSAREHAQCRFPARFALMRRATGVTGDRFPAVECVELAEHERSLAATRVSTVFVSNYVNNPASTFGHVMLYFDNGPAADLLGYSVSFEASTDGFSAIGYMRRGLLGGLSAAYHVAPLHERVGRYERQEQRDLWFFPQQLPKYHVDQLVRHLWELREVSYAYGFFGENCAQKILALVHAVAPEYGLLPYQRAAVLPSEVVRRLVDRIGLDGVAARRPSLAERYQRQAAALSVQERAQLRQMQKFRVVLSAATPATLATALTWSEIKTPSRAFQRVGEHHSNVDFEWTRGLWRSLVESGDDEVAVDEPVAVGVRNSVVYSHRPTSFYVRGGYRSSTGPVVGVGGRWLLHDAIDPQVGYPIHATINVGVIDVRASARGGAFVEDATAIRVERLKPTVGRRIGTAWRMEVGARRLLVGDQRPLHSGLQVDFGLAYALHGRFAALSIYSVAGVRPGFSRAEGTTSFVPALLWSSGVVTQLPGGVRAREWLEQVMAHPGSLSRPTSFRAAARKGVRRDLDAEVSFSSSRAFRELSLAFVSFY